MSVQLTLQVIHDVMLHTGCSLQSRIRVQGVRVACKGLSTVLCGMLPRCRLPARHGSCHVLLCACTQARCLTDQAITFKQQHCWVHATPRVLTVSAARHDFSEQVAGGEGGLPGWLIALIVLSSSAAFIMLLAVFGSVVRYLQIRHAREHPFDII